METDITKRNTENTGKFKKRKHCRACHKHKLSYIHNGMKFYSLRRKRIDNLWKFFKDSFHYQMIKFLVVIESKMAHSWVSFPTVSSQGNCKHTLFITDFVLASVINGLETFRCHEAEGKLHRWLLATTSFSLKETDGEAMSTCFSEVEK